ncbi:hypothetical protein V4U86_23735 [Mycobacterium sp. AMU20-3851]|uniref:hypothetical protein n=1 Tax=Mycobacterium sp. AMU20-3851 TaxID=3122055 RepID=UPI003754476D
MNARHCTVTIVAQDPSVERNGQVVTAEVKIPREDLEDGPMGCSLYVVDYDASARRMYRPASVRKGPPQLKKRDEILADPVFHAWNVYAIVIRTLVRFESALGRRVRWGIRGHQLKAVPHAFEDANAFYSPESEALLFGYVRGETGAENTYLCLSHDVVAHETTHALLDGLRGSFISPSSADQAAFHEAFADIVALLSVFSLPEAVEYLIDPDGDRDRVPKSALCVARLAETDLFGLGENVARVDALRRSVKIVPSPDLLQEDTFLEVHRRGEILVGAVMRTFLHAWHDRMNRLFPGENVAIERGIVAEQGADIADVLLTMCIRAIDYTPPIHITFDHFLSAMLTADREVRADDNRYRLRSTLREQMAGFGITGASRGKDGCWLSPGEAEGLAHNGVHFSSLQTDDTEMFRHVWNNRTKLHLNPHAFTQIKSIRPCVRVAPEDGFQVRETVVECTQYLKIPASELPAYGLRELKSLPSDTPIELRGGSTLVLDEYGDLKYEISDKLPSPLAVDRTPEAERRRRCKRWNDRIRFMYCSGQFTGSGSAAVSLAVRHRDRNTDRDLDATAELDRRARSAMEEWR